MAFKYFQTSLPNPGIPYLIKDILATRCLTYFRGQSVKVVGRVLSFDLLTPSAVVVEPLRSKVREKCEQLGLTVDLSLVGGEDFGVGSLVMMIGELEERERGGDEEDGRLQRNKIGEENGGELKGGLPSALTDAGNKQACVTSDCKMVCEQQTQQKQQHSPQQIQKQLLQKGSPVSGEYFDSVEHLDDSSASLFDSSSKENSFVCEGNNGESVKLDPPENEPQKKNQRLTLSPSSRLNESDQFLLDAMETDQVATDSRQPGQARYVNVDRLQKMDLPNDEIKSMADAVMLKARVAICVDRLDYELYKQSIEVSRSLSLE